VGGTAKKATKNGYVYIYVSNESDNLVYFDNLQITHEHGPLLQEDHYYPYGLGMAGISSKAISGIIANAYKANGGTELGSGEWADGSGLELYETTYRSYNAQTGRFMQVDPLMESTANLGGYIFGGDNPATFVDPTGLRMNYNIPAPPNFGTGDHPDPDGLFDGGGGGGYFSHKDSNGNMWHHKDVLEGTASAAQPYIAGNGVDGFGHDSYAWNLGETRIEQFANAQKYFDKIKKLIAGGYNIYVSGEYTSKLGNHYAGLTFMNPNDVQKDNTISWNLKLQTNYVYQNNEDFSNLANGGRDDGNNDLKHLATAIVIGADSHATAIGVGRVLSKEAGVALEGLSKTGTVVGAIAGGVPEAINLAHSFQNGEIGSLHDWASFGLAALAVVSEFSGLGEAYDGSVGLVIAGGTLIYDAYDAATSKE
jgi:RHS repeat-associated protein